MVMFPNNLKDMEGRKVRRLYYGKDGECLEEAQNTKTYIKEIVLTREDDLIWFCIYENGREAFRMNAKYIETIEWED